MTTDETFQIPVEAAEAYEARFVPAIFAGWAAHTVQAADLSQGDRILDVACGTGIVARTAADALGDGRSITGVDANEAMLTVARRVRPDIDWRRAIAEDLPFTNGAFDVVACQMALMFFVDRERAIAEMARVLAVGGRVVVLVPAALEDQPAYGGLVDIATRHAGPEAQSLLASYWSAGDLVRLFARFERAGLSQISGRTLVEPARFGSSDEFVATEVEGSPLRERISDAVYDAIRADAAAEFADFQIGPTSLHVPLACHVIRGTKA